MTEAQPAGFRSSAAPADGEQRSGAWPPKAHLDVAGIELALGAYPGMKDIPPEELRRGARSFRPLTLEGWARYNAAMTPTARKQIAGLRTHAASFREHLEALVPSIEPSAQEELIEAGFMRPHDQEPSGGSIELDTKYIKDPKAEGQALPPIAPSTPVQDKLRDLCRLLGTIESIPPPRRGRPAMQRHVAVAIHAGKIVRKWTGTPPSYSNPKIRADGSSRGPYITLLRSLFACLKVDGSVENAAREAVRVLNPQRKKRPPRVGENSPAFAK